MREEPTEEAVTAWARLIRAQRVLLVRPPASDTAMSEAFNRLRAELQLQDFDVQVLEVDERKRDALRSRDAASDVGGLRPRDPAPSGRAAGRGGRAFGGPAWSVAALGGRPKAKGRNLRPGPSRPDP